MEEKSIRRRVSVDTTAGGFMTFSATTEIVNGTLAEQIAEQAALVEACQKLWPVPPRKEAKP